ncbi:hypothetical protein DRO55_02140, partial [Candidatus Bathyarchaeota archaeon]
MVYAKPQGSASVINESGGNMYHHNGVSSPYVDGGNDPPDGPKKGSTVTEKSSAASPLGDMIKIFPEKEIALLRDWRNQLVIVDGWNSRSFDGYFWEVDEGSLEDGIDWRDIAVGDMDGDGRDEIVGLTEGMTTTEDGGYKYKKNGFQRIVIMEPSAQGPWHVCSSENLGYSWYSVSAGGSLKRIAVGDFDGDHDEDIMVLMKKDNRPSDYLDFYIRENGTFDRYFNPEKYDEISSIIFLEELNPDIAGTYNDIEACDIDGDWQDEIVLFDRSPNPRLVFVEVTGPQMGVHLKTVDLPEDLISYLPEEEVQYLPPELQDLYNELVGLFNSVTNRVLNWKKIAVGDFDGDHNDEVAILVDIGKKGLLGEEPLWSVIYFYDPQEEGRFHNKIFPGVIARAPGLSIGDTISFESPVRITALSAGDLDADGLDDVVLVERRFLIEAEVEDLLESMQMVILGEDVTPDSIVSSQYISRLIVLHTDKNVNVELDSSGFLLFMNWEAYYISPFGNPSKKWKRVVLGDFDGEDSVYAVYMNEMWKVEEINVLAVLNEPPYEEGINYGQTSFTISEEKAFGETVSTSFTASASVGFGVKLGEDILGTGAELGTSLELTISSTFERTKTHITATCESKTFSTDGEDIVVYATTRYNIYFYRLVGPKPHWIGSPDQTRYEDDPENIISINLPKAVEIDAEPLDVVLGWNLEGFSYEKPPGPTGERLKHRVYTYPRNIPAPAFVSWDHILWYPRADPSDPLSYDPINVKYGVEEEWSWSIAETEETATTRTWEVSLERRVEGEVSAGGVGVTFSFGYGFAVGRSTTHTISVTLSNSFSGGVSSIPEECDPAYRYSYVPYIYYVGERKGISPFAPSQDTYDVFYFVVDYIVLDNYNYPLGSGYKYDFDMAVLNGEAHNINPGHTTRYIVHIENIGGENNRVNLTIDGAPEGWTVEMNETIVELPPFGFEDIAVDVTAPLDALGLTTYGISIFAVSDESTECNETLQLTCFVNQVVDIDISIEDQKHMVKPGESTIYNIIVTNYGNTYDNITITFSIPPPEWRVSMNITDDYVTVPPNGTVTVALNVTAVHARNKDVLTTVVTAVSQSKAWVSDSVVLETEVVVDYGVRLECSSNLTFTGVDETVSFTMTVRNTGFDGDSYDLIISDAPPLWIVTLNQYSVNLKVNETASITLTAHVHVDTPFRTFPITVTATSRNDPTVSSSVTVVVVVTDSDMVVESYRSLPNGTTLAAGDVDGDGRYEIITVIDGNLTVLDSDLNVEWKIEDIFSWAGNYHTYKIAVGNLDNDSSVEVIVALKYGSISLYVINATTRTVEWKSNYTSIGNVRSLKVADADGDGFDEAMIVTTSGLYILDWNSTTGFLANSIPQLNGYYINDATYVDGRIIVSYTMSVQDELYESLYRHYIASLIFNDTWTLEWYNYTGYSGEAKIYTLSPLKDAYEKSLELRVAPVRPIRWTDLVARTRSPPLEWTTRYFLKPVAGGYRCLRLEAGDLDGDGRMEVVSLEKRYRMIEYYVDIFGGRYRTSKIEASNVINLYQLELSEDSSLKSLMLDWSFPVNNDLGKIKVAVVGDFDDDGIDEILAGDSDGYGYVYSIWPDSSEWKTVKFEGGVYGLAIRDFDMDGKSEAALSTGAGELYIFTLSIKYRPKLECEANRKSVTPGYGVVYKLKVTNMGVRKDVFDLSIMSTPRNWIVILNRYSIALEPGYFGHVYLTVFPHAETMAGKTYIMTVAATSHGSPRKRSLVQIFTTVLDVEPPTKVTGLKVTNPGTGHELKLTWNEAHDNTAVTYYNIYRNGLCIGRTGGTSFADTNVEPGVTYTYTISAVDSSGNVGEPSDPVNGTSFDITPPSFTVTATPNPSNGSTVLFISSSEVLSGSPEVTLTRPNGTVESLEPHQIGEAVWNCSYMVYQTGPHIITISGTDPSGNNGIARTFLMGDLDPPSFKVEVYNVFNPESGVDIVVNVTVSEELLYPPSIRIAYSWVTLGGEVYSYIHTDNMNFTSNSRIYMYRYHYSGYGQYNISISGVDLAGNNGTTDVEGEPTLGSYINDFTPLNKSVEYSTTFLGHKINYTVSEDADWAFIFITCSSHLSGVAEAPGETPIKYLNLTIFKVESIITGGPPTKVVTTVRNITISFYQGEIPLTRLMDALHISRYGEANGEMDWSSIDGTVNPNNVTASGLFNESIFALFAADDDVPSSPTLYLPEDGAT